MKLKLRRRRVLREKTMAKTNGLADIGRSIEIETTSSSIEGGKDHRTLNSVLRGFVAEIFSSSDAGTGSPPPPLVKRIKKSFLDHAPYLREASRNSATDLLRWTKAGGPLRALFVISVGTITLLAVTGLLVFMLFFLAATFNSIIISVLMSLAAVGGFLALLFACLTAIYIGALSVAICVISVTTISAIFAVIIATGWVGFFWVVWVAAKKCVDLTKQSLSITSSAISAMAAYSVCRRPQQEKSLGSPLVEAN